MENVMAKVFGNTYIMPWSTFRKHTCYALRIGKVPLINRE